MTTTEKGALHPKTFSIEWKIERFFADCEKVGDCYESHLFPIQCGTEITEWYLQVYPRGENKNCEDHVSLYLCFQSDDVSAVTVEYELSILCRRSTMPLNSAKDTDEFKSPHEVWGWEQFVEQTVVRHALNGSDTLTILCEITFHQIKEMAECLKGYDKWLDEIDNGLEDYEKLLESNYFSDVTFNVQGKEIHLHKDILMCRNSVFKAMFEHEMKEKTGSTVDITDVDYDVMKELFRFIYSGKVKNVNEIAKDLLVVADKYDVTQLKALCEKTLYDNLRVDNAIEYLKLTDVCNTLLLRKLVIKFVVANLKDIVPQCDFKLLFAELDREVVCEIMQAVAEKN